MTHIELGQHTVSVTLVDSMTGYADWRTRALAMLAKHFGGATLTEQQGAYVRQDTGEVQIESGCKVWAYVGQHDARRSAHFIECLAQQVANCTDQECVLYTRPDGSAALCPPTYNHFDPYGTRETPAHTH